MAPGEWKKETLQNIFRFIEQFICFVLFALKGQAYLRVAQLMFLLKDKTQNWLIVLN